MKNVLVRLVIHVAAILLISHLDPRLISVDGFGAAVVAALVLGLVNAVVRPIFVILTLPLTILSLGLFLLVINALLLWGVSGVVPGFHVNGFGGAFLGSILISLVSWVLSSFVG